MQVSRHVVEATLEATITRADGTVEHLGVIDSYREPAWRRAMRHITDLKSLNNPPKD